MLPIRGCRAAEGRATSHSPQVLTAAAVGCRAGAAHSGARAQFSAYFNPSTVNVEPALRPDGSHAIPSPNVTRPREIVIVLAIVPAGDGHSLIVMPVSTSYASS